MASSIRSRGRDVALDSLPLPRPQRQVLSWNDYLLVLEIARQGSVARAAQPLAMSHVTLLRKLDAIEARVKTRLFNRTRNRYVPTEAGEAVIEAAAAMAPLAQNAELRVLGKDLRPSGHVRVAVAGVVVEHLLPPVLKQFASAFPEVTMELVASRDHVSLARREADVAIRITDQIPDWLVGRLLGHMDFRVYTLRRRGLEPRLRDVQALVREGARWIGFEREATELKFDRWLNATVPAHQFVLHVDSFSHALTMLRAGLGVALLPTFVEASCADLQPLTPVVAELRTPMWVLTHQELRHSTRIKVLMQAVAPALSATLAPG